MEDTYTYTARSARHPEKVITFTLHDDSLTMDVGAMLEQAQRTMKSATAEEGEEAEAPQWLKPMAANLMEVAARPFHVGDIEASAKDEGLQVAAWVRAGGLRTVPFLFVMERVDNPEAAQTFVKELKRRKTAAKLPAKMPGPLDYWFGWLGIALGVILTLVLVRKWTRDKEESS